MQGRETERLAYWHRKLSRLKLGQLLAVIADPHVGVLCEGAGTAVREAG